MVEGDSNWRRSSYCADHNCVEVAKTGEYVYMRDAKTPSQTPLTFSLDAWYGFLDQVSTGGDVTMPKEA